MSPELIQQFEDGLDLSDWINNIVDVVSTNSEISNALIELFSLDTSKMSANEVKQSVDTYVGFIAGLIGEDSLELKLKLGFDDTDTDAMIVAVREKITNEFDAKVGQLSIEDLDIAANKLEIPQNVLLTWDELIVKINEYKNSLAENSNILPLSISDTITQIDTQLRPALDALKKSYQDIFTEDGFTLENVDIKLSKYYLHIF